MAATFVVVTTARAAAVTVSTAAIVNPPQVMDTRTIGPGGTYATFTAAINDLNANGVGPGGVTFNVTAGQTFVENPPAITATGTAADPIVFQRSGAGANPQVRPTGGGGTADFGLCVAGGDYITFDGIDVVENSGSAVEFGFLIRNSSATNGARNVTVRNAAITLNRTNTSSIGLLQTSASSPGGGFSATAAGGSNRSCRYHDLTVHNAFHGLWLYAASVTFPDSGNEVGTAGGGQTTIGDAVSNDIGNGSLTTYGIRLQYQSGSKVFATRVQNVTGTGVGSVLGIDVFNGSTSVTGTTSVYGNTVSSIRNSSTSLGPVVYGIRAEAGGTSEVRVYDNDVYGLTPCAPVSPTSLQCLRAMSANASASAGTVSLYFNSVRVDQGSALNGSSTVLYANGGTVDLENNIFANVTTGQSGSAVHYADYIAAGTVGTSSHNILYAPNSNGILGRAAGADRLTLPAFAAATSGAPPTAGAEGGSANDDPSFASATDLTFPSNTPAAESGTTIAGITTDINGAPRGNPPDVGAHATTAAQYDKSAPVLSGISIVSGDNPTVSVVLTDNSAAGSPAPIRLWYRLGSAGAFTGVDADVKPAGMNGTYQWQASLSGLPGGNYQCYIAARDLFATGYNVWAAPMWATTVPAPAFSSSDPPDFASNPAAYANVYTFTNSPPPNLVESYSIEDNRLRLIFDRNLDLASAQNTANYQLGSHGAGSTVNAAALVGGAGAVVELTITSAIAEGAAETITAQNIGAATCGSCVSSPQTLGFVNGVVTVAFIQAPDPAFLGACEDRSRFSGAGSTGGSRITVRGVAVQSYGTLYYIEDASGGPRSGIAVSAPGTPLVTGHGYRIAGRVAETGGETQIVSTVNITDEGAAPVPPPAIQTIHVLADAACDATQSQNNGEDWEGTLVTLGHSMVVNSNTPPYDPPPGGSFRVVQAPGLAATDTMEVSSLGGHYAYDPRAGDVNDITGVLHFEGGSYRLLPRSNDDIAPVQVVIGGAGKFVIDPAKITCYQPTPSADLLVFGRPGAVDLGQTATGIVDVLLSNESIDFEVVFKDSSVTSPALRARVLAAPTFALLKSEVLDSMSAVIDTSQMTTMRYSIVPGGELDTLVKLNVRDSDHGVAGFAFYEPSCDSVSFLQAMSGDSLGFYAHDSLIAVVRGDGVNGGTDLLGSDGPSESAQMVGGRNASPLAIERLRKVKSFMKRNFGKKFRQALREQLHKDSTKECYSTAAAWALSGFGLDIGAINTAVCTAQIFIKAWRKGRHNIYGVSNSTTLRNDGSFQMTVPAGMGWNGQSHVVALDLSDEAVPQNATIGTTIVLGDCSTSAVDAPLSAPGLTSLAQNRPNPFRNSTLMSFSLAQPAHAEVRIFDVSGRRLRSLDLGALVSGPHLTAWDGRDEQGVELRPGTYFMRLVVNGGTVGVKRMVMMK